MGIDTTASGTSKQVRSTKLAEGSALSRRIRPLTQVQSGLCQESELRNQNSELLVMKSDWGPQSSRWEGRETNFRRLVPTPNVLVPEDASDVAKHPVSTARWSAQMRVCGPCRKGCRP